MKQLKLIRLSGDCGRNDCPTVYATDRGTFVVQGDLVSTLPGLTLSEGEAAVEIPVHLVEEAIRAARR